MSYQDKNMRIGRERNRRDLSIFGSILLMLATLFISSAALSISMIVFLVLTLLHSGFLLQLKKFRNSLLLVSITVLFFIPFVSVAWSSDLKEWSEIMRIKLPLLVFPLAFAGDWKLSTKQWLYIAGFLLLLLF